MADAKDDPWNSTLREIIDSFRRDMVFKDGAEKTADAQKSQNDNATAAQAAEMGRGRNVPTELGTPGRFNTLISGQESQQRTLPEKDPLATIPPHVRREIDGIMPKDVSLGRMIETAKPQTPAPARPGHANSHEHGR